MNPAKRTICKKALLSKSTEMLRMRDRMGVAQ
jgi:hypothetical protein